jgi:hypothetical protein
VIASVADIERSLFSEGDRPWPDLLAGRFADGFAVFFFSYSTWLGSNCLYLEDLYINPNSAAAAQARSCCATWPGSPATTVAAASSGACWTGTSRRLPSTNPSAPAAGGGCAIAWKVMRYGFCPGLIHLEKPVSDDRFFVLLLTIWDVNLYIEMF